MNKVLVVFDDGSLRTTWSRILDGKVEMVFACSGPEVEERFAANSDIVAIVIGVSSPDNKSSDIAVLVVVLVRELKVNFNGPIIAMSNSLQFSQQLVEAGCTGSCHGLSMPRTLINVLGL